MEYFLPTYEQAKEIAKANDELIFYENINYIDGYKISVFNYRLAQYKNFIEPIKGKNYKAYELRGLTFVFNKDGSLYKRYLLFHKFFNINQVTETMYSEIKGKKIKYIYNKDDGTLISFIKLPNGKILPRTKTSFDNNQVKEVKKILKKNNSIINFVSEMLDKGYTTMWEYVSFKNKIVLNYNDSKLILLKVRNNETGEYIDIEEFRNKGFEVVKKIKFDNLDEIISWVKTAENVEGVVVTFEDDFMIKIKTRWYFELHHLLTEEANREDFIIKMILEGTIDDLKSKLNKEIDKEKILWIEEIEKTTITFLNKKILEVKKLISNFNGNIKDFAIKYKKDKNFPIAIKIIKKKDDIYTVVKNWLLKSTNKLELARRFIIKKSI